MPPLVCTLMYIYFQTHPTFPHATPAPDLQLSPAFARNTICSPAYRSINFIIKMAVVPTVTTAVAAVTTQWVAPTGQTAMYAIAFGKAAGLKPLSKDYRVPEGYGTADYIPTSRGHIIFIICAVTMGISVFVVVARIITRRIVTGWLGMEDYMMIPALVCLLFPDCPFTLLMPCEALSGRFDNCEHALGVVRRIGETLGRHDL